nr:unnamed protein product [Callosobruchus analis]
MFVHPSDLTYSQGV